MADGGLRRSLGETVALDIVVTDQSSGDVTVLRRPELADLSVAEVAEVLNAGAFLPPARKAD